MDDPEVARTGSVEWNGFLVFRECQVIQFPSGRWGFVGRVPIELHRLVPATKEGIMGGRTIRNENGDLMEYRDMSFDTRDEAQSALDNWLD